jgi:hypothetical protein
MRTITTVVFIALMATACVGDPDVSTRTQGVAEGNAIAINAIAINGIALNGIAINGIAINSLSNNLYVMTSTDLLATDEGREVLKYVVSCAIPTGTTLTGSHAGITYNFIGEIGLAPAWLGRGLRETEQRWVSACLLSRVNRFGVPVSISIRGPHQALTVTEEEALVYSVEEGAFYGNVFQGVEGPMVWNACRGRDQAVSETGTLELRDCTEPDPENPGLTLCGFNYTGDCGAWAQPDPYACEKYREPVVRNVAVGADGLSSRDFRGGFYEKCFDSAGFATWQHAERFPEVITVFVKP